MVQWESVKTTNPETGKTEIKNIETSLSPGQTGGTIKGVYVTRSADEDTSLPYYPTPLSNEPTFFRIQKPKGYREYHAGLSEQVRRGETNLQYVSSEPEKQRFERYMAQQQKIQRQKSSVFQLPMFKEQYRYSQKPTQSQLFRPQQLTTYPLYKKSAETSKLYQAKAESYIKRTPLPEPVKKVARGTSSIITGLPEYFGSGFAGIEYAAREPGYFKSNIVNALKSYGSTIFTQAKAEPEYTLGQGIGILALGKIGGGKPTPKKTITKPKGKPVLEKMFGTQITARQQKTFGGQRYYIEPSASVLPTISTYRKMFGGEAKTTISTPVLKNMFGTSAYVKPRKTTVMDILLVRPARQVLIQKQKESMFLEPAFKFRIGEAKYRPMIDFEGVYRQQAVQRILQYTKTSTYAKPSPQITVAKPIKTYGVMEQIRIRYQAPRIAFKPVLRTAAGQKTSLMLGLGVTTRSLFGQVYGQQFRQLLGQQQLQGLQQAQRQTQGYKTIFKYPQTTINYPRYTKTTLDFIKQIREPGKTKTPDKIFPPKTPEPPIWRMPKIPKARIPGIEIPGLYFGGMQRKRGAREKTIVTRMLQLSDLFNTNKRRR